MTRQAGTSQCLPAYSPAAVSLHAPVSAIARQPWPASQPASLPAYLPVSLPATHNTHQNPTDIRSESTAFRPIKAAY